MDFNRNPMVLPVWRSATARENAAEVVPGDFLIAQNLRQLYQELGIRSLPRLSGSIQELGIDSKSSP